MIKVIEAKNINDINHIKKILDNIREYVTAYENQNGELPKDVSEDITFQICEIEEFIIGTQRVNSLNSAHAILRMMTYWHYINGKCNFIDMMAELKKYEGEV